MDNLTLAIALLQTAKDESCLLKVYEREVNSIRKKGGTMSHANWNDWEELRRRFPHPPTKTSINDKIKVARGLLAAAYIK